MGAFDPRFGIDAKYYPNTPQGGSDTLAMARMYMQANNRPPQFQMAPVQDIGGGIAAGVGNIANALMYRNQMRQQNQMLDGLAMQIKQERDQQLADQQAQYALKQDENRYKYNTLVRLAQGQNDANTLADSQMLGIGTPGSNIANSIGTTLGTISSGNVMKQNLPTMLGADPATLNTGYASPQLQLNASLYGINKVPDVGTLITNQANADKAVSEASTSRTTAAYAPKKEAANLFNLGQDAVKKGVDIQIAKIEANYKPEILDQQLRNGQITQQKYNEDKANQEYARQLIADAQKNGSLYDPKQIPTLQLLLQARGINVDLMEPFKNAQNPKAGVAVNPALFAPPKPKPTLPAPKANNKRPGLMALKAGMR